MLASVTAGSLLSLVGPTANAVTYVDATARDVTVRYNDCKTTTVNVTGDWDTDAYNEIRIVVRTPGNRWFDEKTVYDDYDGSVQMNIRLCDEDRSGDYGVKVVAIGYDESYEEVSRVESETSFEYTYIAKKKTRIRHRVVQTPNQPRYKYAVPGRLVREGRGYKGERVLLVVRIAGDWYKAGAMRTRRHGYFGWQFAPNAFRWRYFYRGNRSTEPSVTDIFRTPRRTSGRAAARTGASTLEQARAVVQRSGTGRTDR